MTGVDAFHSIQILNPIKNIFPPYVVGVSQ